MVDGKWKMGQSTPMFSTAAVVASRARPIHCDLQGIGNVMRKPDKTLRHRRCAVNNGEPGVTGHPFGVLCRQGSEARYGVGTHRQPVEKAV